MVAAPGGTVKVPLIGTHPKKQIYMLGGVAVAVVGVAYYRSKKAASTAVPATTTDQIDPATGFTYGSPEDSAALAQQASYNSPGGAGGGNGTGVGGGGGSLGSGPTSTIVDNSSWSQAASQYLVGVVGLDGPTVSSALGAYISAAPLTDAQVSIVQQAIAAVGYPPTPGTAGNPPGYVTVTTPPTGGNTTGGTTVTKKPLARPTLAIKKHVTGSTDLVWTNIPNAYIYQIYLNGKSHQFSGLPSATVLPAGVYTVKAEPSTSGATNYTDSPLSNAVTVPK